MYVFEQLNEKLYTMKRVLKKKNFYIMIGCQDQFLRVTEKVLTFVTSNTSGSTFTMGNPLPESTFTLYA
jgi:hypothetical protein